MSTDRPGALQCLTRSDRIRKESRAQRRWRRKRHRLARTGRRLITILRISSKFPPFSPTNKSDAHRRRCKMSIYAPPPLVSRAIYLGLSCTNIVSSPLFLSYTFKRHNLLEKLPFRLHTLLLRWNVRHEETLLFRGREKNDSDDSKCYNKSRCGTPNRLCGARCSVS